MAITIPGGLKITNQQPVDARFVLTKEEMKNMIAAKIPDQYFCINSEDGCLYLYNVNNTSDPTTGKFRKFERGGEPAEYLKSAAVSGNKLTLTKKDNSTVVFEPQAGQTYTAGENIQINNNVISATDTKYTAGTNITIDANNVISAAGGATYQAGNGINITDNTISTKLGNGLKHTDDGKVTLNTADSTINVGEFGVRVPYVSTSLDNTANGLAVKLADNTIEAYNSGTGTKGLRVNQNIIQPKLTAGQNITIDNNVISATGGVTYTAGTNISITDNQISVSTDDIELTGTSGTFTDEQMQKLSNSTLTCLILNNKRFKLQYTSVGRSGIVAMYTSVIDSVSEIIEVDVTNKAWAHAQTALQSVLTAGDNVSIINNVVSAVDTKLATQITLGQAITAQSAIGGIPAGKVYAATDTLATLLTDLLGGEAPSGDGKIYYSTGTTVPTSVTGMTSVAVQKDTLLASGYTWKNITLNNEYAFLAIDKSLGITCYEIKQNGYGLSFESVDLGTQWLYYPSAKATDTGVRLVYSFEE